MTDPFAAQKASYARVPVAGEAQFLTTGSAQHPRPTFRLILESVGLEFTDGDYVGTDPKGEFYYHKISDFSTYGRNTQYHVSTVEQDGNVWVHVEFFKPNREVWGEFFAHDHNNSVRLSRIEGYPRTGNWNWIDIGSSSAVVRKAKNERTVTITANAVEFKAAFNVDQGLAEHEVDVHGELRFKHIRDIHLGGFVRWNPDILIFYENDMYSKDWTAYFMPSLDLENPETALGGKDTVFHPVTWTPSKAQ